MRSTNKNYKLKSEINVVPYIDVMLVLLIIFMVTAPMLNTTVDIHLPQSHAKTTQEKKEPVVVEVTRSGQLFLTLGKAAREPVDAEGLKLKVGAFVKDNPTTNVLVAGDREVSYDGIYQVLADLQQAGAAKVGLMGAAGANGAKAHP